MCGKKVSPKVVCHFLSNHLELLREILHVYYSFRLSAANGHIDMKARLISTELRRCKLKVSLNADLRDCVCTRDVCTLVSVCTLTRDPHLRSFATLTLLLLRKM